MNPLAQALMVAAPVDALLARHVVSDYTPTQIREAIADLVRANQITLAEALSEAGLSLYPHDENTLSMAALLASLREDWRGTEDYLRQLIDVQGTATTAFTWNLLIRSLRCQCEPFMALVEVRKAMKQHPDNVELLSECADLEAQLGATAAFVCDSSPTGVA